MKLIGITGSCGKTSVAEILYQYLLFQGIPTSLYSSNGNFINGLTRVKDFFQTTLYHKDLEGLLSEDENSNIEYGIIEITGESVKRLDEIHSLDFEVIAMTNFYSGLHNHFNSKEEYLNCKRDILKGNTKKVLLWSGDKSYPLLNDITHETFGYLENDNYRLIVMNNTIEGLDLIYQNIRFKTNLLTAYHARNLSCALAILESLSLLDMKVFKEYAKNIFIRGRFEKFVCNGVNIIIDTGLVGAATLFIGLEKTIGNNNFKTIFSTLHYDNITPWVTESRKRVGNYLKQSKFIYLTSPTNNDQEEEIFINDVVGKDFRNYSFIKNPKDAVRLAINELIADETIVIFARGHYRMYRNILEEIKNDKILKEENACLKC